MKPTGYVFYRGASMINGEPIIGIVTLTSGNVKTGNMLQTWILADHDRDTLRSPDMASKRGQDAAICGDCPLRRDADGNRACYVVLAHGPASVGRAASNGKYPTLSDDVPDFDRPVRLGAYGDPTAIPFDAWQPILRRALAGWTGYTHQWKTTDDRWTDYLMASVESSDDTRDARESGWRTFRVVPVDVPTEPGEITCPASAERGYRQTCESCKLCSGAAGRGAGSGARHVRIAPHGSGGNIIAVKGGR